MDDAELLRLDGVETQLTDLIERFSDLEKRVIFKSLFPMKLIQAMDDEKVREFFTKSVEIALSTMIDQKVRNVVSVMRAEAAKAKSAAEEQPVTKKKIKK